MLENMRAADFESATGKTCTLHLPDGSTLSVVLDSVTEKPQYRNPYAKEGHRLPFSIGLTAQQASDFIDGSCHLEFPDGRRIDGIGTSRVAPLGRDPLLAYYQMIFN